MPKNPAWFLRIKKAERYLRKVMLSTKPGSKAGIEAACRLEGVQIALLAAKSERFTDTLR